MTTNQFMMDVIDLDGKAQQVEIVMAFESDITKKQYVVYTKNEVGAGDRVVLYASVMEENNGKIILTAISDEEWKIVKNKMREVIHSGEAS